ncbi:MAG: hypothetical protein AAFU59_07550 [Pseudomonadota bacterium]
MSDWDFELQRAQTAHTLHHLETEEGVDMTLRVTLDLEFLPGKDADPAACTKALAMFGYHADPGEDGTLTVQIDNVALTLDEVWLHEERTTKIALARGFTPDGWGFLAP